MSKMMVIALKTAENEKFAVGTKKLSLLLFHVKSIEYNPRATDG